MRRHIMQNENSVKTGAVNPNQALIDRQLRHMARVEFIQKYGAVIILVVLFVFNSVSRQ